MTPHNRVLLLVGGAAVIASLAIAAIFIQTNAAEAVVQADEAAALSVQALGDRLVTEVHEQREALGEYLLFADPRALARYRRAVTNEAETAGRIGTEVGTLSGAGNLSGVTDALASVEAENDAWRATVADPAIAAVQSGSIEVVKAAIQSAQDQAATQSATSQVVVQIDALQSELNVRSDALSGLRLAAASFGVVIELLAAGLSLWFVRRYGLRVARDSQRRMQVGIERIEIIASLRTLRTQATPEATAVLIAEALNRLPGSTLRACSSAPRTGCWPSQSSACPGSRSRRARQFPKGRARYLRDRSDGGPWAERWIRPAQPNAYDQRLGALGIKAGRSRPSR